MKTKLALIILCLCCAAATALAEVDARMLRYPDVSETHIAFVYAGDIWLVEKGGGTAHRLSSPLGEERFPRLRNLYRQTCSVVRLLRKRLDRRTPNRVSVLPDARAALEYWRRCP